MKKLTFILFLVCIQLISFSQDTVKQWNVTIYDDSFSPQHTSPTWTYYGLKTGTDTLISGKFYKILFKTNDSLFLETQTIGGIREDSNRIYLSESVYSLKEVLLYDFNLDSGDSIIVYRLIGIDNYSIYPAMAAVDSISTIIIDGEIRKKLFIEYHCADYTEDNEKDVWVEGIGSIKSGLLNESCWCLTGCYTRSYLTCYSKNNSTIWKNPIFNSCYIDSSTIMDVEQENTRKNEVSITAIEKRIQIQSKHPISSIQIMNLMGQTIYLKKSLLTNFFELDLLTQDNGLYIFVINNRDIQKVLIF